MAEIEKVKCLECQARKFCRPSCFKAIFVSLGIDCESPERETT